MSMLLIDAGNSRIKWGVWEADAWLRRGAAEHVPGALQQAFSGLPAPRRILAANVAGAAAAQHIRSACAAWPTAVEFIVAPAGQCGVRNAYSQPAQLGSDRWAALVAAWQHEHAACLVVDCGTATTVDALSADGVFIGGLILPGLDMMRRSLASGAPRLDAARGGWREFPRDTADAVYSGAIQATGGAIRGLHALLGVAGARCLLAGGAADEVAPHLELPLLRMDDLVLRGLQIIGQETGSC